MIYFDKNILVNTDKIVFFDIDQTLSSMNEFFAMQQSKSYDSKKRNLYNEKWNKIKKFDFVHLSILSVNLFASLLEQHNAKAVCVSSWNIKGYNNPEEYLNQLKTAFESLSGEFPKDWLLGFSGASGGDRHLYSVTPFLEETNFKGKYISIDDGAFEYSDQSYTVQVNGQHGFSRENFMEASEKLK